MEQEITVFLIDDDLDDQELFSLVMEGVTPHIQCVFANDGLYALEKLRANLNGSFIPNYIFLDINMPRMNGVQCLEEIKKMPHVANIPVYMYSTSADSKIVLKCTELGASGFIQKISDMDELQNAFRRIIANQSA